MRAPATPVFDSSGVGDVGLTESLPPHPTIKGEHSRWAAATRATATFLDLIDTPSSTSPLGILEIIAHPRARSCRTDGRVSAWIKGAAPDTTMSRHVEACLFQEGHFEALVGPRQPALMPRGKPSTPAPLPLVDVRL
jgi:hypothetical protein